jgi:hypothetical protein
LPIQPRRLHDIAHAVMAPLRLRTFSQRTVEADDGERQLRNFVPPSEAEGGEGVRPGLRSSLQPTNGGIKRERPPRRDK